MSKNGRQFFLVEIGVTPQNWQTVMTKKGHQFFQEKNGVTPLVAAPGDTHLVTPLGRTEFSSLDRVCISCSAVKR